MNADYWETLDRLIAESRVVIDRPKGTRHPRFPELAYPLDYGYLEGTTGGDGHGIDVWLGASGTRDLSAVILTVDMFKRDAEIKLLLGCSEEETRTALACSNNETMRAMLILRPHTFLRARRSVRRFKADLVPDTVTRRILETATFAPSAHNAQPWRFAVAATAEAKDRLIEFMAADFRRDLEKEGTPKAEIAARLERSRRRINEAPLVVIMCMEASGMNEYPDPLRRQAELTMAVQSTALAGLQLLLAAHAEGLGAVWTCGPLFAPEAVRAALELPPAWQPQAMFFIGYPAETPAAPERRPLEQVVIFR
jgi:F420 biosynthesis protein FbiB-like protein